MKMMGNWRVLKILEIKLLYSVHVTQKQKILRMQIFKISFIWNYYQADGSVYQSMFVCLCYV